jgi:hypothetical protein
MGTNPPEGIGARAHKAATVNAADVLGLALATSLAGCTVAGAEVRSVASLGPEAAVVHACPAAPKITYWPASAGAICYSIYGIEIEVRAETRRATAVGVGPILPLVWWFPRHTDDSPLEIGIFLKTEEPFTFDPWRASVRTLQGEGLFVTRVMTNVHGHTVDIDPRAARLPAHARFFLTFEKHLPPEQEFELAIPLVGPDGTDVPLPTVRFAPGKVRYLGTVP